LASGFLVLFDDIAVLMDDAEKVSGFVSSREIPIFKGYR
jgi:predicted DNA repair protein MutK